MLPNRKQGRDYTASFSIMATKFYTWWEHMYSTYQKT